VDERIVLDDAAVVGIVDKLVKQRKDSITAFEQGGRCWPSAARARAPRAFSWRRRPCRQAGPGLTPSRQAADFSGHSVTVPYSPRHRGRIGAPGIEETRRWLHCSSCRA
jgi:hypothetical protein